MRTFLSHDATARCSDCGENLRSDIPSSGGEARVKSFLRSPIVLLLAAVVADVVPKRAMVSRVGTKRRATDGRA